MTFWDFFWLFAIFIPLTILWISCVVDVTFKRHDLPGVSRAAWVLLIIILPAIGSLAYLAFGGAGKGVERGMSEDARRDDALRMTGRTP